MDADKAQKLIEIVRRSASQKSAGNAGKGVRGVNPYPSTYPSKAPDLLHLPHLPLKNQKGERGVIEGVNEGVIAPLDLSLAPSDDPVVMIVPAGDDPFATAAELIRMSREKATPGRRYQFRLTDQAAADRRNREAAREGITDRWCSCGALATYAWPDERGRQVWICNECAPTRGMA